jgi:hypothetical protein
MIGAVQFIRDIYATARAAKRPVMTNMSIGSG